MKTNRHKFYQYLVPPGFGADKVEFFAENRTVKFIQNGETHSFDEITIDIALRLRHELNNDPTAMNGMALLNITDPNHQLEKFAFCRYGFLNLTPDLEGEESNPEYWPCPYRPCLADGLICKYPKVPNGTLTRSNMNIIREVAADNPAKIIADHLQLAIDTINKECQAIVKKIGCHSKTGIANYAGANNIF